MAQAFGRHDEYDSSPGVCIFREVDEHEMTVRIYALGFVPSSFIRNFPFLQETIMSW